MQEVKRTCGTCTACCDGWLTGTVNGHEMYPGVPCHYLNKTCTIYNKRPTDPCKSYQCEWLRDPEVPAWMRPDFVKAILTLKEVNGIRYAWLTEMDQKLDSSVLSWLFMQYLTGKYDNIMYNINGHPRKIGTQDFIDAMEKNR